MSLSETMFVGFSASALITVAIVLFVVIWTVGVEPWKLRVVYVSGYSKYLPSGFTIDGFLCKWTAIREAKKIAEEKSSRSTCIAYSDTKTVVLKLEQPKNAVPHGKVIW